MKSMSTEKNELKKKTIKTLKGKETFRTEISGRLSQDECEKIWRGAHKRLYKLIEKKGLRESRRPIFTSSFDEYLFLFGKFLFVLLRKGEI